GYQSEECRRDLAPVEERLLSGSSCFGSQRLRFVHIPSGQKVIPAAVLHQLHDSRISLHSVVLHSLILCNPNGTFEFEGDKEYPSIQALLRDSIEKVFDPNAFGELEISIVNICSNANAMTKKSYVALDKEAVKYNERKVTMSSTTKHLAKLHNT